MPGSEIQDKPLILQTRQREAQKEKGDVVGAGARASHFCSEPRTRPRRVSEPSDGPGTRPGVSRSSWEFRTGLARNNRVTGELELGARSQSVGFKGDAGQTKPWSGQSGQKQTQERESGEHSQLPEQGEGKREPGKGAAWPFPGPVPIRLTCVFHL